jgi:hypothetical protein
MLRNPATRNSLTQLPAPMMRSGQSTYSQVSGDQHAKVTVGDLPGGPGVIQDLRAVQLVPDNLGE